LRRPLGFAYRLADTYLISVYGRIQLIVKSYNKAYWDVMENKVGKNKQRGIWNLFWLSLEFAWAISLEKDHMLLMSRVLFFEPRGGIQGIRSTNTGYGMLCARL